MSKTYEDERLCGICEADTMQTIHESGHERDSSGDWQECHICGGRYSGLTGEWKRSPDICPVCGGEKSQFLHPMSLMAKRADKDQECLTCGLKVSFWSRVPK